MQGQEGLLPAKHNVLAHEPRESAHDQSDELFHILFYFSVVLVSYLRHEKIRTSSVENQVREIGSEGWRLHDMLHTSEVEYSSLPRKAFILVGLLLGVPPSDPSEGQTREVLGRSEI